MLSLSECICNSEGKLHSALLAFDVFPPPPPHSAPPIPTLFSPSAKQAVFFFFACSLQFVSGQLISEVLDYRFAPSHLIPPLFMASGAGVVALKPGTVQGLLKNTCDLFERGAAS